LAKDEAQEGQGNARITRLKLLPELIGAVDGVSLKATYDSDDDEETEEEEDGRYA